MQANLTGLEKIFLDSWEGWDGDIECLMFYDVNIKETFLQKNNIIIPKDCGKIDCTVFVIDNYGEERPESIAELIYIDGDAPIPGNSGNWISLDEVNYQIGES